MGDLGNYRGRIEAGLKWYAYLESLVQGVVWLVTVLALVQALLMIALISG